MRVACLRHGVKGIIIDPYNEIDSSRQNTKREDEHIRDLISACKQFCRRHNVTMWMVAHPDNANIINNILILSTLLVLILYAIQLKWLFLFHDVLGSTKFYQNHSYSKPCQSHTLSNHEPCVLYSSLPCNVCHASLI